MNTIRYFVHYISFANYVIDWGVFATLEEAMENALYWVKNKRNYLDRIEIFKADCDEVKYFRDLIAVINA